MHIRPDPKRGMYTTRVGVLCILIQVAKTPLLNLPTSLMPISVMPPCTLDIGPDLVILLGLLHELHVQVHNTHPFSVGVFGFIPQRPDERHRDSAQSRIR